MQLYGREWPRRELEARVGRLEQIGGLRRLHWAEGSEAGTEAIQVRSGAGLEYLVLPSRGLDISLATFGGVPLTWQGPGGDAHPAFYDAHGFGWLRTAAGGLLMTCGLTYVGAPGEDEGAAFGLHGRAHHLPARQVSGHGRWVGDEYQMEVGGIVEEVGLFLDSLRLTRTIRSRLGENRITIDDVVENIGFSPAPHMILYHCNFGFPLMSEETTVSFPSRQVTPREPETPLEGYDSWQGPDAAYQERVYYHEDLVTDAGRATVTIRNPRFPLPGGERPLAVRVGWDTATLPRLIEWKMPGAGAHVLGIEPANCYVEGRAAERRRGTLVTLEPGETRTYHLELEVDLGD
jgi:hypothetical protein